MGKVLRRVWWVGSQEQALPPENVRSGDRGPSTSDSTPAAGGLARKVPTESRVSRRHNTATMAEFLEQSALQNPDQAEDYNKLLSLYNRK